MALRLHVYNNKIIFYRCTINKYCKKNWLIFSNYNISITQILTKTLHLLTFIEYCLCLMMLLHQFLKPLSKTKIRCQQRKRQKETFSAKHGIELSLSRLKQSYFILSATPPFWQGCVSTTLNILNSDSRVQIVV